MDATAVQPPPTQRMVYGGWYAMVVGVGSSPCGGARGSWDEDTVTCGPMTTTMTSWCVRKMQIINCFQTLQG